MIDGAILGSGKCPDNKAEALTRNTIEASEHLKRNTNHTLNCRSSIPKACHLIVLPETVKGPMGQRAAPGANNKSALDERTLNRRNQGEIGPMRAARQAFSVEA